MTEIMDVRIEDPGDAAEPAVVVVMSNGVVLRDRLPTLEEARRKVLAVQAKAWPATHARPVTSP
jgi:hypothetical protein